MKRILAVCALIAFASCSPQGSEKQGAAKTESAAQRPIAPVATQAPAGAYRLDKAHASLLFRVNHLGFSHYTARFKRFDAELHFDPADPAASRVSATVDARSLETDYPDPALDFNAELQSEQWLNTARFPEIAFRSTSIELTGPNTARIIGDFTLRGVTRPLTLDATFNGGYAGLPVYDPHGRIGFSARGTLKRSDFGIAYGIPEPGSNMGVSDDVEIIIEAEFTGPPLEQ